MKKEIKGIFKETDKLVQDFFNEADTLVEKLKSNKRVEE